MPNIPDANGSGIDAESGAYDSHEAVVVDFERGDPDTSQNWSSILKCSIIASVVLLQLIE